MSKINHVTEDSVVEEVVLITETEESVEDLGDRVSEPTPPRYVGLLDTVTYRLFAAILFLLPIVVIPGMIVPLESVKKTFFSVGISLVVFLWLIARLSDCRFSAPRSAIFWSGAGLLAALFLSTLGSGAFPTAFWGTGSESGTFISLLLLFLASYLVAILYQSSRRISSFFFLLQLSFLLLALASILHLMFPSIAIPGVSSEATANLLGKWNDLGIFVGLMAILSFIQLELFRPRGISATFLWSVFLLAVAGAMVVNFYLVWLVLAFAGLSGFVYLFSKTPEASSGRRVSRPALLLLIVSLLFIIAGSPDRFVGAAFNKLGLPSTAEVRPSWSATYLVARETLSGDPVLGSGLNRFSNQWVQFRPADVGQTIFWNVDFNAGVGFVPSFAVTSGYLGILAWLLFLSSFLAAGVRRVVLYSREGEFQGLTLLAWVGALYLWLFAVIYVSDTVILGLTLVFTGLFLAATSASGLTETVVFAANENRRVSFIATLVVLMLSIGSIATGYTLVEKLIAQNLFGRGLATAFAGDLDGAITAIKRAVALDSQDVYYRSLAEGGIARINQVLVNRSGSPEELRIKFQAASGDAIVNARAAVERDETKYLNWVTLGTVYQTLVPAGVEGAYDLAKKSYERALALYPSSPAIRLARARLEAAKGDRTKAKEFAVDALAQKSNYTAALFLLSQLQADEGNLDAAIKSVEQAAFLAPQDVGVFFQLGLLNYTKRDYQGSIAALERAIALVPSYSNARYFLGLSYDRLGRRTDAIAQFREIGKLNPGNAEVAQILQNLTNYRDALDRISPPAPKPERRTKPPINDEN